MKRIYSLFVIVTMLFAYYNVEAQESAQIFKATSTPNIDGDVDNVWDEIPAIPIAGIANAGDDDATVSGTWKALWDADNVYFLIEVTDDIKMNIGTGNPIWYLHDCVEIFTDLNNTKVDEGVTNSEGQYQLRFIYGLDAEPFHENPTMTGYENVSKDNTAGDGYVIEVKMPWSNLTKDMTTAVDIKEGLTIGFDIKLTDMDADPAGSWWPAHWELAWNSAAEKKAINFGNVTLANAPIKQTTVWSTGSAPAIDGTVDAVWENTKENPIAGISNAGDNDATVSGTWKALWDTENVYFLFEVTDDIKMNIGTGNPIWYLHDCVEVYTDLNNTKVDEEVTNSEGQYQLRFIYGLDEEPFHENPTMTGYENVSKDNTAGDGYVIEVKMPWSNLTKDMTKTVAIEAGLTIGLDVKLTDIDADPAGSWWPAHWELVWNSAAEKKSINFGNVTLMQTPDTEAPVAPANLVADRTDLNVVFTWDASTSDDVVGYNIKNDGVTIASVASVTTETLSLDAGLTYNFTVTAIDGAGNESNVSNSVEIIVPGQAAMPEGTPIAMTETAPAIDGTIDAVWNTAKYLIGAPQKWAPKSNIQGQTDAMATFAGLWDDTNLYLLLEVQDDNAIVGADEFYVHDCVEVLITDGDTDYKYRFVYSMDNQIVDDGDGSSVPAGFQNVSAAVTGGYVIEVAIPWSSFASLGTIQRTTPLAIKFQVTDIDDATDGAWGDIDGHLTWPMAGELNKIVLGKTSDVTVDDTAPATPAAPTAEAIDDETISISWTAATEADFLAYIVKINGELYTSTSDNNLTIEGLGAETTYEVSIMATDGQLISDESASVSVTTPEKRIVADQKYIIGKAASDPTIDFALWEDSPEIPLHNSDRNFDESDLSAYWKAMWDDNNLYIQVVVKDDDIYNSGSNVWENDNVEFHFDMNDERDGTSCESSVGNYQEDNVQYRAIANNTTLQSGSSNAPIWDGVGMAFYPLNKDGAEIGYTCEMVFPWASLTTLKSDLIKFTPVIGSAFGFVPKVTDKDGFDDEGTIVYNNEDANGILLWNQEDMNLTTARDNSEYGTMELGLTPVTPDPPVTNVNDLDVETLSVYPNPVNDVLNIELPNQSFDNITISDLTGRTVLNKSISNSSGTVSINMNELTSGIYIISVQNKNSQYRAKVSVK